MGKTIKEIAEEIGVSKQAVFKKIKREPLSTGLQGLTTTVDGRLIVSVDGEKLIKQAFLRRELSTSTDNRLSVEVDSLVDESSTKNEENKNTDNVDSQNRLFEILERELQSKNEQIAALQEELFKERQHSREQAERIAVLADQAQRLQAGSMKLTNGSDQDQTPPRKKHWWQR